MLVLLMMTAFVIAVPVTLYFAGRLGGRNMWGLFLRGYEKHGSGAYRAQMSPVWVAGKPPIAVHIAAITSFILGQMVIPGSLAALLGLVISLEIIFREMHSSGDYVIVLLMLSAPTGLYIGAKLLDTGLALMQRAENAAERARRLARLSILHNLVLLLAMILVGGFVSSDAIWFPVVYAFVSIAQAGSLTRAARAVDAHRDAEAHDRELAPPPPQWADGQA
jgi:hypothetical protein